MDTGTCRASKDVTARCYAGLNRLYDVPRIPDAGLLAERQ